jgi:hypothetical protein
MPMALEVLVHVNLFVGGDMSHGMLLYSVLKVDKRFWQEHQRLWWQMNGVLVKLHSFQKFMEQELLPAAEEFKFVELGRE